MEKMMQAMMKRYPLVIGMGVHDRHDLCDHRCRKRGERS